MAIEIPKVTKREFNENRGEYRDVQVEDRPYRLLKDQFNEDKGIYHDVKVPLTDMEILEAGGIKRFFKPDGSRRDGSWPYDPNVKPGTRKKASKKRKSSK